MRILFALFIFVSASACADLASARRSPSQGFRYLELAIQDNFDSRGAWRSYQGDEIFLGVRHGAFQIDMLGRQYVWSQHDALFSDTVLEADIIQASTFAGNAFGLACRLDPANSGRGYYFLISGDGYASIRWSNGRALEAIVPALPASHIKPGGVRNRLRAVCIDDYLALWVNGEFVADARDQRASSGAAGMAAVMNYAGKGLTLSFDDLRLWRAALDDRAP